MVQFDLLCSFEKRIHFAAWINLWEESFFRTLLLQALDARRMVLHKEQEMAFASAEAAGFDNAHLLDLIEFSESFHVSRLRY